MPDGKATAPRPLPQLIARLQPMRCGGSIRYAVVDEHGVIRAVATDHALARTVARLLGFEPVSVH